MDVINPNHPFYNVKGAIAKTVRHGAEPGTYDWGNVPGNDESKCAHSNNNMHCIACHSSWNPSCFGCHLPQRANAKMPFLHAEGEVSRNYTPYCFQTLRDDVY